MHVYIMKQNVRVCIHIILCMHEINYFTLVHIIILYCHSTFKAYACRIIMILELKTFPGGSMPHTHEPPSYLKTTYLMPLHFFVHAEPCMLLASCL